MNDKVLQRVRYGSSLVSSLRARARLQSSAPDLRDELALSRALLEDAIDAYDAAIDEAMRKGVDNAMLARVKLVSGDLVAHATERVRDMALAQSKVTSTKYIAIPDVGALLETCVGAVDAELVTRANDLRMIGIEPEELMERISARVREVSLVTGAASDPSQLMAEFGPEAQARINEEAELMDSTVPEYTQPRIAAGQ